MSVPKAQDCSWRRQRKALKWKHFKNSTSLYSQVLVFYQSQEVPWIKMRIFTSSSNPLPFYLHSNEVMSCCLTFVLQLRFLLPRVIHCRGSGFRKISRAKRHKSEEKVGGKGGLFPSYLFPNQIKKSCNSKSCFHQHSVVGNKKVFEPKSPWVQRFSIWNEMSLLHKATHPWALGKAAFLLCRFLLYCICRCLIFSHRQQIIRTYLNKFSWDFCPNVLTVSSQPNCLSSSFPCISA